jgi:hypothetical protein
MVLILLITGLVQVLLTIRAQAVTIPFYQTVLELSQKYEVNPETVLAIRHCENPRSDMRPHLNNDGSRDYGYLQVNDIHKKQMTKLGLDITDPNDSLEFGIRLLKEQGLAPWYASKSCWLRLI